MNGQWYSKLMRISNYDQARSEQVRVEEISHMTDQEQVEAIADSFSAISNMTNQKRKKIYVQAFPKSSIPKVPLR